MDQELHWGGWWEGRAEEKMHKGIISNTKHLWKTHGRPVLVVGKTLPWEGVLGYIKWRKWAITSLIHLPVFWLSLWHGSHFRLQLSPLPHLEGLSLPLSCKDEHIPFLLDYFHQGIFFPAKGKETKTMGLVHLSLEIIFIFNVYYTSGSLWCDHSPPVKPSSPSLAYWQVGRLRIVLPFSNVVS